MTRHGRNRILSLGALSLTTLMALSWLAPAAFAQVNVPGTDIGVPSGGGSDAGSAVGGVTDTVTDTVGDTSGAVGGVTDPVGGAVGGDVGDTIKDTGNAVQNTGGKVGETVDQTGETVKQTTRDTGETVDNAVQGVNDQTGGALNGVGVENPLGGLKDRDGRDGGKAGSPDARVGGGARKLEGGHGDAGRVLGGRDRDRAAASVGAFDSKARRQASQNAPATTIQPVQAPAILEQIATAAVEAAKKLGFPLALTLMVVGFLVIQGRIDRKDAKLALAPIDSEQEFLSFG